MAEIEIVPDDVIVCYMGDNKSQLFSVIDFEGKTFSARSPFFHDTKPAIAAFVTPDEISLEK
jgi:hypothetical protein